jgi:short subunit dehydrogenase-like uncharacterized protein
MRHFLIYGANGYTGTLIAGEARARGQRPVLAGRNAEALASLASALGFEHRVFGVDDPDRVVEGLSGMQAVLNCAGPFTHTYRPIVNACLQAGVHYLDITGETTAFEGLAAQSAAAKAVAIMLLPGVGFDVVPSDCLAAHLKRRLPSATHLTLGFQSHGRMSRGTATTVVENLHGGGLVRQDGVLRQVPSAWKTRVIDFGTGPVRAITIPWGDVSTAYRSTGIPNIEVYMAAPRGVRLAALASRHIGWLLGTRLVQGLLRRKIRAGLPGPTDEERARGRTYLWGEALANAGQKVVSRLQGPEGYTLTVQAALAVVERVLAGDAPPGFQTPSSAYGCDFVLSLKDMVRTDE